MYTPNIIHCVYGCMVSTLFIPHRCMPPTLSTRHTDVWVWHYALCIKRYSSSISETWKWKYGSTTIHPDHRCTALTLSTVHKDVWLWWHWTMDIDVWLQDYSPCTQMYSSDIIYNVDGCTYRSDCPPCLDQICTMCAKTYGAPGTNDMCPGVFHAFIPVVVK